MTNAAVVAYLDLPEDDRDWIEDVRARYDPQASLISAHFTLVSPASVAIEPLVAHVRINLARFRPIPFVLRRAAAVPDAVAEGSHVFLLPEEGREELLAVHDRLYDGVLRPHLRSDIPFVPHVTVGACRTLEECDRLAVELNHAHGPIRGAVHGVEVIEVGLSAVRTVASVPFGEGAARRPPAGRHL